MKPAKSSRTARTGQTRDFQIPLSGFLAMLGLILSDQVYVQSPAQCQAYRFDPLIHMAMRVSLALNQTLGVNILKSKI
jgi:hypothetical protein